MEISNKGPLSIQPLQKNPLTPPTATVEIIDQNAVKQEVGMLAKIGESFDKIVSQTKNFIDRNIDGRAITNSADKILQSVTRERDKYMPDESKWNDKIESFISNYQSEKRSREQSINTFLNEIQEAYTTELKALDGIVDIEEKSLALEGLMVKFTSIGHKIGETIELLDADTLKKVENALGYSNLSVPWVKVGILCQKTHVHAVKIESCEKEIASIISQLATNLTMPPQQKQELESRIHLLQRQINEFKAENKQFLNEIVEASFKGTTATLDVGKNIFSGITESTITNESVNALSAISIAVSGAALAGAVVSLGLKVYQTAQSSDQLITLKSNIDLLKKEHLQETEPIKAIILKAKLDRLEVLERDISIQLAKNVLEGVAGSLALCASVQALMASAGVVLGSTAAICFNATGVGAAVLGTGLAIGGAAYGAYKHRHEIKHALATADIAPRKLFNEYSLHKEIQVYESASKTLKEMETRLEMLQLTLPAAWETKQQIDALRGGDAHEKQKLITRKFIELQIDLTESTEHATAASLTMAVALPNIKRHQHEMRVLQKREELEDMQLELKQMTERFSKYEVYTLMVVQSIVKEALGDEKGINTIKELMSAHGYPPHDPLHSEEVFDFIMESTQVLNNRY